MRIGIDVGGTFTDLVSMSDDGTVTIRKVPSTVEDYSVAIADALPVMFAEREATGREVREVLHATTVATNAILQLSGARTALVTTMGFRDVLELRRMRMPELYNWNWDKPHDLVERRLRFELAERIDARGNVIVALESGELAGLIDRIVGEQVESIAICLLNSYINSAHEEMIAEALAQRLPGVAVSISSQILREVKEYERTATVVVNAYVLPLVRHYIRALEKSLKKIDVTAPLMIMQSNGGMMTAGACSTRPAYMIESGPAAGVIAAHAVAQAENVPNLIAFDMGGTTAKASIIENGQISSASEYEVGSSLSAISRLIKGGGHLIRVPAIDIAEVVPRRRQHGLVGCGRRLANRAQERRRHSGPRVLRAGRNSGNDHRCKPGSRLYQPRRTCRWRAERRSDCGRGGDRRSGCSAAQDEHARCRLWSTPSRQFEHDASRS